MKRIMTLSLGLLAFALLPAFAQTPAPKPTGKIHGRVIDPTGVPKKDGTVSLSTDSGAAKFTFPVSATGDYSGEAAVGTYKLVYRLPETPADKMVDFIDDVKISAGVDLAQDIDMTRKAYMDQMSPEDRKKAEEFRKKNAEAMKANEVIKNLNADLIAVGQDIKDTDAAQNTAAKTLGAGASSADIEAKTAEIKAAKYNEIETLMLKDTAAKPDASVLWARLGQGELGLKKYDEAAAAFKKALDAEAASHKPNLSIQGLANSGLGEVYARTGKIPEASAAYDAAAKVDVPGAENYFKNEAVVFSQVGNADAQTAAAEKAIAVDPAQALPYYLKGQGLIGQAAIDPKTGKMILPPGCAEAYLKYLDLAPTGQFAADVKAILSEATQTHSSTFGNQTPTKKKKGGN